MEVRPGLEWWTELKALQELARGVVQFEGPVHTEEVARRLQSLCARLGIDGKKWYRTLPLLGLGE